jgi:hypothetical protein
MKTSLSIIFLFFAISSFAQVDRKTELYRTILQKDSLLFAVGFNTCDITQFERLLGEDFEFFHDTDSISRKEKFLNDIKNGLCASPTTYQSRRELDNKKTEIYPLYTIKDKDSVLYGAIQIGVHSFYENISGNPERFASKAQFTHLWILENGEWKLLRSLSYDHQTTKKKRKK